EAGLNLPDAAALIRGEGARDGDWKGPPPVATVTLAEIYAAQGHLERALKMLDEVLAKEPDHDPARALRDRLAAGEASPPAQRKRMKISFVEREPEPTEPDPDSDLETEITPPAPVHAAPVEAAPVEAAPIQAEASSESPAAPNAAEPAKAPAPAAELCLVTLALSGRRQLYWELPAPALAALRAHSPEGRAVLRVVTFRTRAGKVERTSLDFAPHAEVGVSTLPGASSSVVVRAALGWETAGQFKPFLLAADLAASGKGGQFLPHPLVRAAPRHVEARAIEYVTRHG
ncbi:MAG TPA: tetratricopeptide repeat protein, partial [Polyangiaceae bacterium]